MELKAELAVGRSAWFAVAFLIFDKPRRKSPSIKNQGETNNAFCQVCEQGVVIALLLRGKVASRRTLGDRVMKPCKASWQRIECKVEANK